MVVADKCFGLKISLVEPGHTSDTQTSRGAVRSCRVCSSTFILAVITGLSVGYVECTILNYSESALTLTSIQL